MTRYIFTIITNMCLKYLSKLKYKLYIIIYDTFLYTIHIK